MSSARVLRAELVHVTYLYSHRNEWVDWNGHTNQVQRRISHFFTSDAAYANAEKSRGPGTQFSALDSVAVALHLDRGGMAFLFMSDTDSPFQSSVDPVNRLADKSSLHQFHIALVQPGRVRMQVCMKNQIPTGIRPFSVGDMLYQRHAKSGGSKHSLAWSMKPGSVLPGFGLQLVDTVNAALEPKQESASTQVAQATQLPSTTEFEVAKTAKPDTFAPTEPTPLPPESPLASTEREQVSKARIGQDLYRYNLEQIESKCRVTGLKIKEHLIASHIKPWRDSTDAEKLDGNNGLLLSPHIDRLFDKGFISFSDDGRLLVSPNLALEVLMAWHITADLDVGAFNAGQRAYLAYHRENVFRHDASG